MTTELKPIKQTSNFAHEVGASQAMNFQTLFALGMKRYLPELKECEGPAFDVGASGKYVAPGAIPLGAPTWVFPRDKIPVADDSAATLHAYHFFEHLSGDVAVAFLREVERVLIPERGVLNFSIPYYSTPLAAQNLDHKSQWCEDTFKNLFTDDTYDRGAWQLRVHFLLIAGIVQTNLCVIGQIVKRSEGEAESKWYYPERL
jgi:hypothetical protein